MHAHRPLILALGACLLQACVAPPAKQALVPELAIQPVLRVRHSSDQTAATYYQLGKYHLERGNFDLARSAYEYSLTLDGRQLEPRNALAALHAQQGRLDEARALLEHIVADYPGVAHPYNNLGYVYYLQNNYAAAITTLQQALALDAGNERARNNLDAVQRAQANHDKHTTMAGELPPPLNQPVAAPGPVTAAVADTRSQGLVIMSPPLEPQARMEVVQVVPNVYELRLKSAIKTVLADLQLEKTVATAAPPLPLPALARTSAAPLSRIEVANGNGINGMARRISHVLGQHGIAVSRLTNERPYKQQDTKIQYRPGYEQTAQGMRHALGGYAVVVPSPYLSGNSDVRLVLGKDAIAQIAQLEGSAQVSLLTAHEASH